MILRVDNVFFVTPDVAKLSNYYGNLLNVPARRAQVEGPGLMWAEIPIGGMECSFRKAEATTQVHPRAASDFLECKPGGGVTISFEVRNTDETIDALTKRGCKFFGKPLLCTGGKEVISIFQDHTGRAVQLYEARVGTGNETVMMQVRGGVSLQRPSTPQGALLKTGFPQSEADASFGLSPSDPTSRWGYITAREIRAGSNLRDGRNLAYSAAFYDDDLKAAKAFYHGVLGLPVAYESSERLRVDADGTILEFRQLHAEDPYVRDSNLFRKGHGGIPMFEVRNIAAAEQRMSDLGIKPLDPQRLEADERGRRLAYTDYEGNIFEFWERPDIVPLNTAQVLSMNLATMETWQFQSMQA